MKDHFPNPGSTGEQIGYLCPWVPIFRWRICKAPPLSTVPEPCGPQLCVISPDVIIPKFRAATCTDVVIICGVLHPVAANRAQVLAHHFAHSELKYTRLLDCGWHFPASLEASRAKCGRDAQGTGL